MSAEHSTAPQPSHPTMHAEDIRWAVAKSALGWLSTQNPLVVVCILMLGLAGYSTNYAINTAIPAHLESIQKGYEAIHERHKSEREQADAEHRRHYEALATQMQATSKEIRDVTKAQEQLIREFLLPSGRSRPAGASPPREGD
jgi:hypothetical protein